MRRLAASLVWSSLCCLASSSSPALALPAPDTVPAAAARPAGAAAPGAAAAPPVAADRTVRSLADGVPIRYRVQGKGGTPVVLIHCLSCDLTFWDGTVAALARTRQVVSLDLAGHGASGAGRKAWTMASFAADVKTVVETLRLRNVVLVGHSMGASVMLEAARLMPERVRALVAVDALHDLGSVHAAAERDAFLAPFEEDFAGATEAHVRRLFHPDADPAVVESVAAKLKSAPPAIGIAILRTLLAYDPKPALKRTRAPLVALNAGLFPTNVEGNKALVPRFELVPLEGVGHFPQLEQPDAFNARLAEVLARW